MFPLTKAHAYGNDFLYVEEAHLPGGDRPALARDLCERCTGVGADGLIVYRRTPKGAAMQLLNADGSYSEVSGNGVRGLAAVLLDVHHLVPADETVFVETDAGEKALRLLGRDEGRPLFRAAMGQPADVGERDLDLAGENLRVAVLRVGNPQCVRLEAPLSEERMRRLGPQNRAAPRLPGRHERRVRARRVPEPPPDPDLGAGRRSDPIVGNRNVRGGSGGSHLRRRQPGCAGDRARGRAARGMARRRLVPDGVGGGPVPGPVVALAAAYQVSDSVCNFCLRPPPAGAPVLRASR